MGMIMEKKIYNAYVAILREELIPALGCTEPIALAYCAALARQVLGTEASRMEVYCSGNIIKNVKSVTVPNSNGMRGIEAAAILGYTGGDADAKLEVLEAVGQEDIDRAGELLEQNFCKCHHVKDVANLYIRVELYGEEHSSAVTIANHHTQVQCIRKDGEIVYRQEETETEAAPEPKELLNVRDILAFADSVELADVRDLLERQIRLNSAISDEGLQHGYGAEIGRTILETYGNESVAVRAKARAAAGSDARMNGCALPVVINSGSGNQGITCSIPVVEYGKQLGVSEDKLLRGLVVSNLVAIHQKKYIGSLSAYCGAVSAACGAGAGIAYLYGEDYQQISETITNTIANIGGVVCDGAKSSCAAKIASSVDAAIMANNLAQKGRYFKSGEGLVENSVEETIQNLGYVGKVGMKETDNVILGLMIGESAGERA